MSGRCGYTGCAEAAAHVCAHCGMPLCDTHAVTATEASGRAVAYCPQCRAYLRAKAGDAAAQGIGRRGAHEPQA